MSDTHHISTRVSIKWVMLMSHDIIIYTGTIDQYSPSSALLLLCVRGRSFFLDYKQKYCLIIYGEILLCISVSMFMGTDQVMYL